MIDNSFWKSGAIISLGPDQLLLGYGSSEQFESQERLDLSKPSFYFPDFFLKAASSWIQYSHWLEISPKELLKILPQVEEKPSEWSIKDKAHFESSFNDLQTLFVEGILEKAVPYIFTYSTSHMTQNRLLHSLRHALLYRQKFAGHLYGHWNDREGVLGVTPERLFTQTDESVVSLTALAGTIRHQEQQTDPRIHHEHQVVVQAITESLSPFGEVRTRPLQLLQLAHFIHLKTPIELHLSIPVSFTSLVQALHPTPALGAYPRKEGWHWLMKYHQKIERNNFGAPVGALYQNQAHCYVSIRQVQWNSEGMCIGAGCGVVKESRCEEEWNELELKIKAIKESLAL